MNHLDKVFSFGRKKIENTPSSPVEALRKLYDTDEEVAVIIDAYVKRREQVLAFNDVTAEDRMLLEQGEQDIIDRLSLQGINVSKETIEEMLSDF